MGEEFKLPASSYDEVVKIIIAYGQTKEKATLDDLHQYCGVSETTISRNSGFLLSVNIIEGGRSKNITDKGEKLARALEHNVEEEISRIWQELITENDFLTKMVTAVKIRKGMEPDSLQSHIAYSSGQKDNQYVRTGSNTIIEIFKKANLIEEVDGNLVVKNIDNEKLDLNKNINFTNDLSKEESKGDKSLNKKFQNKDNNILINININIETTPDELDELGQKIDHMIKEIKNINNSNDD